MKELEKLANEHAQYFVSDIDATCARESFRAGFRKAREMAQLELKDRFIRHGAATQQGIAGPYGASIDLSLLGEKEV